MFSLPRHPMLTTASGPNQHDGHMHLYPNSRKMLSWLAKKIDRNDKKRGQSGNETEGKRQQRKSTNQLYDWWIIKLTKYQPHWHEKKKHSNAKSACKWWIGRLACRRRSGRDRFSCLFSLSRKLESCPRDSWNIIQQAPRLRQPTLWSQSESPGTWWECQVWSPKAYTGKARGRRVLPSAAPCEPPAWHTASSGSWPRQTVLQRHWFGCSAHLRCETPSSIHTQNKNQTPPNSIYMYFVF